MLCNLRSLVGANVSAMAGDCRDPFPIQPPRQMYRGNPRQRGKLSKREETRLKFPNTGLGYQGMTMIGICVEAFGVTKVARIP